MIYDLLEDFHRYQISRDDQGDYYVDDGLFLMMEFDHLLQVSLMEWDAFVLISC